METALLIVGILVFAVSFFLPAGKDEKVDKEQRRLNEKEIAKQVKAKVEEARKKINKSVDESVSDAVEKAERSLDKLTNEKIMAVNEYSDTVLADIHKNHEEVVFLYDMLNDKQTRLKDTVREAELAAKTATRSARNAQESLAGAGGSGMTGIGQGGSPVLSGQDILNQLAAAEKRRREEEEAAKAKAEAERKAAEAEAERLRVEAEAARLKAEAEAKKAAAETRMEQSLMLEGSEEEGEVDDGAASRKREQPSQSSFSERNRNGEILALHREGKSNVDIARQLHLGVGEVKLVIDLFKEK